MLPPFRIRCLQRPPTQGRSVQRIYAFDSFVRVSAPEYDDTIRICPEASLKYLDDDDGETITVGSSLELIQRLESPSSENLQHLPHKDIFSSSDKLNFTEDELCPTTQNSHIFSIDCRDSSLKIWQEIRRRSLERSVMLQPPDYPQRLEAEASSKNEVELLSLSDREHWKKHSSPISSSRYMNAKDVCADDLKVHVGESDNVSRLQELEDCRTACFQVRNLPDVKPSPNTAISQQTVREHNSKLNYPSRKIPPLTSAMAYPLCHITLDGKRKAQAAGDKLRARSASSRRKRDITAPFNQAGYQNRWASYNDPISFHPRDLSGSNQLSYEQKLSSQGKRQPQLAGDKLRSRTNPVRHAKSIRGPTEHGVNKHRRCPLVGSRIVDSHDLAEPSRYTESLESGTQRKNEMQASLLQVFEAELAKPSSKSSPANYMKVTTNLGLPVERPLVPSPVQAHFSAEKAIQDAKTSLNGMGSLGPQPCAQVLELALRATLSRFEACATQITNCMQEVSTTMRLADKTRELDIQVLDNAVASFRNFTGEILALEKALQSQAESTEQPPAKTDRQKDSSLLIGGQGMQSNCTVILWPIPDEFESREIKDILLLHTKQVKSVLISEPGEGGLRFAFCTVKDDRSAQAISRKMAGQMLNGSSLNVVLAPTLEGEFFHKNNDVFKKTAFERHIPSLFLRNSSDASPQSTTSLTATSDANSGTIDVVEEPNQKIKPAAANLTFTDHSKSRSDSRRAQPVSLPNFVETANLSDTHISNPQISPADTFNMQLPLTDTTVASRDWTNGDSLDSDKSWCTQSGSRTRTKLCSSSILPIHNTPTNVLRYHGPGPLHLAPEELPVFHGSFSPHNESDSNSQFSASRSNSSPTDEYADPKLGSHLLHSPFALAPDTCGRDLVRCSDQSLQDSAQPKVEDQVNTPTKSSVRRAVSYQDNAMRACRSMGTLFQRNSPVDLRQYQTWDSITGKGRILCSALNRDSSSITSKPVCDTFHEKKIDFPNHEAQSPTKGQTFQASGSLSKLFSLQNNAEMNKSNPTTCTSASSSDRSAIPGESDQQPEISLLTSRFPTLEQFEDRHFEPTSRFPSIPSIIPLKGSQPRAQSISAQQSQPSSLSRADSSDSVVSEVWNVRDVLFAGEQSDAASDRKIEECVSQLHGLGFGVDGDGGLKRLVVYAQAADGDLVEAIDIIDEEQRAYMEINSRG